MVNEINLLKEKVKKFSVDRDWEQYHSPKELAIALVLESSEVLDLFRFKENANPDSVALELADVLNILLRLSDVLNLDIIYWFEKKMAENEKKYPISKCHGLSKKYDEL
ncbi:nucleotide pyrophosphohydrolase [Candidatus Woesearchaeota archaeon]|jgi:NTP pyrophosphatase (non-canonical NTP hydrolase)|nr:nucleotide pyrophosphohydrolase [Candidatus Woesearchaeota archaeon]